MAFSDDREQRTENREQRAESREQGTENMGHGTWDIEQRAGKSDGISEQINILKGDNGIQKGYGRKLQQNWRQREARFNPQQKSCRWTLGLGML